ncbi:hypothetical protein C8J57DRAFT_1263006 [Mycena rebaudengoi]|nr:hypothetical protein C8J57DRAFT_1263006 [Mycena rebaudengoi]
MPSGGAWQMLLGKPMLRAFAAVHEYVQDTVTLCTPEGTVTLTNESDAEGTRQNKVAIAHVSDPGECCGISPLKQRQVDGLDQHDTVDDALGLLQDTAQSPSEVSQDIFGAKACRRQRSLVLKVERMQARGDDGRMGRGSQTAAIAKVVFSAMGLRATTGGKSGTGGDGSRRDGGGEPIAGSVYKPPAMADGLRKHKVAVASASNPGERCCDSPEAQAGG